MPQPPDYPRVPPPPMRKSPQQSNADRDRAIRALERPLRNQRVTRNADGRYQVTVPFSEATETTHDEPFTLPSGRWVVTVGVGVGVAGIGPGSTFSVAVQSPGMLTTAAGPRPLHPVLSSGAESLTVIASGVVGVHVETDASGFSAFSGTITFDAIAI